jgi:hypothetical protein
MEKLFNLTKSSDSHSDGHSSGLSDLTYYEDLNITEYYGEGDYQDTQVHTYTQEFLNFIKILCEDFKEIDEFLMYTTVAFGVLTNILCIIVFARPNFKKTNMGVFYINISAWNIIFLLFYMLVIDSHNTFNYNVALFSDTVCKLSIFFKRVIREMPPWIEAYLTVDRYLAVCHPHKFKKFRDRKYITPICFGLFAFLCVISIENLWYHVKHHIKPSHEGISTAQLGFEPYINVSEHLFLSKCTTNEALALTSDLISILLRVILPGFLMCIFSYLIVSAVLKSKKKLASRKQSTVSESKKNVKKSRESTFTNTVVYMNIIFLILNTPVTIMMIVINFYYMDYDILDDAIIGNVYLVTYDLSNFYYSLRFVFNLIFNRLFQDEFFLMFNLKKSSDFSSKTSKTKGILSTRGAVSTRGPISTIR